jgi:hypothetical protein
MRYRLRTLLLGSILMLAWALATAIATIIWGEEILRYFTHF